MLDASDFTIVHEGATRAKGGEPVTVVKFSPSGGVLAVGSRDGVIYTFDATADFASKAIMSGHSGPILNLDWSADSLLIQVTGGGVSAPAPPAPSLPHLPPS